MSWYTAADLLALGLPALPVDKGAFSRFIERQKWRQSTHARETERGWEYSGALLPVEAQAALALRDAQSATAGLPATQGSDWQRYEQLPETARAEARRRLGIVDQVEQLKAGGAKVGPAVALVATRNNVSASTLWNWISLCDGVARANRLSALAPRRKGRVATVEIDPRAWDFFVGLYLRAERPTLTNCYRRTVEVAAEHGWGAVPALKTFQRRLEKQVPAAAQEMARYGRDAAARLFPHQSRDRTGFHAMQAVNADGHKFDVFVRFADGRIGRPLAAVLQDLGTGMILACRIGESESWTLVRTAFADMVERYGIPDECWLDNGRAFASKWLTGGMANRFRFKVKDDEPMGVLTQLGIRIHWTTPYHGQAKPIERAFRDWADEISKHPAFAGAYTGNHIDAKPENYGSKAIPIATFKAVVAEEVARHNARQGRRGNGMNGASFAEAFARSLAAPGTIVTRATEEQRRLLLLAAEGVTCRKPTGEIEFEGNRYWHENLIAHKGRQVTVRFDPDDLHQPMGVYDRDNRLICVAEPIDKTGFADSEAARTHAKDRRSWLKAQKQVLESEKRLSIDEIANLIPKLPTPAAAEAPVVRLFKPDSVNGVTAEDEAAAHAAFGRAVRALDESQEGIVIPFRAAEAG